MPAYLLEGTCLKDPSYWRSNRNPAEWICSEWRTVQVSDDARIVRFRGSPISTAASLRRGPGRLRLRFGHLACRAVSPVDADFRCGKSKKSPTRQLQHKLVMLQAFAALDRSEVSNEAEASTAHSSQFTMRETTHVASMHYGARASILDSNSIC
jgi:hypothetical protein